MSEFGSMSLAFRLDAVDWDRRSDGATLHLTGRWRRRRPIGAIQPVLVVERAGTRHRIPARPEPPGLSGIAPGAWRMSFELPVGVVPQPGDRMWLQVGGVMVALPLPDEPLAADLAEFDRESGPEPPEVAHSVIVERRLAVAEQALEAAQARRAAATARQAELEAELVRVAGELEAAREALTARDRKRRVAEQREHSERAERLALQAELAVLRASLEEEQVVTEGDELRLRIDELEAEREDLLRRLAEAEQARAAAPAMAPGPPAEPELGPAPVGRLVPVLDALGEELSALRGALERERAARSAAEARVGVAEGELAASRQRAGEAYAALERLRLDLIAAAPVAAAPRRPAPAAAPLGGAPAATAAGLDPSRFDVARSRLRTVSVDETPTSDWLARAMRSLAGHHPDAAGQLALALLPVQALHSSALRYDLVLGDAGVVLVDVPGDRQPVLVQAADTPRAEDQVDFAFHGSLAALGRLLAAGRLPRRGIGGRGRGRIAGDRTSAAALGAMGNVRLRFGALLAAGVALDGNLALELAAHAIDPALTRGERWTIAFAEPGRTGSRLLLRIRDGGRPAVLRAPLSAPAAAEVQVAEADLASLLAAAPGVAAAVQGDPGPLERIRGWLLSAQSG